jgi:voltage-gated potassium channel
MTTVGYGDISPKTGLGQAVSSVIMILGYGIIAVPTGIVTVELTQAMDRETDPDLQCRQCFGIGHDRDSKHCKHCGEKL